MHGSPATIRKRIWRDRNRSFEVVILNQGDDTTFEEDLAKDVLEIITVFSARLYGSRSRKNQRLLENVKKAVEEV